MTTFFTTGVHVRSLTGKALGLENYVQRGQKGVVEDLAVLVEEDGTQHVQLYVRFKTRNESRLVAMNVSEVRRENA